jgi:hypothetical protein
MDATVVCIDQTKKSVQVEPRAARKPRSTRPSVELSGQCDWTCPLGAITEDGDRFFARFEEYVTADTRNISFLHYENNLEMICSSCWMERRISGVARHGCQVCYDLAFVTLPAYSPN